MLHYLQSGGMFEAENLNACSALIALREWESGLRLATRWRNLKTFFLLLLWIYVILYLFVLIFYYRYRCALFFYQKADDESKFLFGLLEI